MLKARFLFGSDSADKKSLGEKCVVKFEKYMMTVKHFFVLDKLNSIKISTARTDKKEREV